MLRAHESPAGIIRNLGDVVGVPATQSSDRPVVVTGVEHDQVEELSEREATPDTQVVVHVHLADGHPLEVRTDGVHLALVDADAAVLDEGLFGVVEAGGTITVAVVRDLVVVPHGNPGELGVREEKVEIGAVGRQAASVIVQGEDLTLRLHRAGICAGLVLVDVVAAMTY